MKRLSHALALILLILSALAPGEAFCGNAHRQAAHACCRSTSHTPEIKTCCAPRPVQQSALPLTSPMASAAAHLHHTAPAIFIARLSPLAHLHPIPSPPDAAPPPPLILRI